MSRLRLLSIASLTALAAGCSQSESVECGPDVFCPPGFQCIEELSYCINPLETLCGNGVQDEGEQCDDGNLTNGDGCSWNCRLPFCGDKLLDTYEKNGVTFVEVCDDGNNNHGDGCAADCASVELCGDGELNPVRYTLKTEAYDQPAGTIIAGSEACDPKPGGVNEAATAECNLDCTRSRCGDGKVNGASGEECDPGTGATPGNDDRALASTAECNDDCTFARCGDEKTNSNHKPNPLVNRGEQCDFGSFCANYAPCTVAQTCIDLAAGGAELGDLECRPRDLPCCTASCFNHSCGDGVHQRAIDFVCPPGTPQAACEVCRQAVPEQCDDGNLVRGDGCDDTCKTEMCGDRQVTRHPYVHRQELASDGVANGSLTALVYGTTPGTIVNKAEVCDDGMHCSVNGKLCWTNDDCVEENGTLIGDGECRPRNGDGCSADCLSEERCGDVDGYLNDYPIKVFVKGEDLLPVVPQQIAREAPAELCDDGNLIDKDGCNANCLSSGVCGNGVRDDGEACDYGSLNGTGALPDRLTATFCLLDPLDPFYQACEFPCNATCSLNVRGNRVVDPDEECDDGMTCANGIICDNLADCAAVPGSDKACRRRNEDNCTNDGRFNLCGDGVPNLAGGFAGLENLTPAARVQLEAQVGPQGLLVQTCDSRGFNTAECDYDCTAPQCGDLTVCGNTNDENCNPANPPALINFSAGEYCDNGPGLAVGSTAESASCNTDCQFALCGDGMINATRGEVCDDENLDDGDGCSGNCRSAEVCGDGIANRYDITVRDAANDMIAFRPAEVCDEGEEGGENCTADCQSTKICGDRYINDTESCDDGNTDVDDGCSETCGVELGWVCPTRTVTVGRPPTPGFVTYTTTDRCDEVCGDGLVVGDETCDDGNTDNGDGCSSTCRTEVGWSCVVTPAVEEGALHDVGGVCAPICGDRLIRGGEQCDDGNVDGREDGDDDPNNPAIPDGCSPTCVRNAGFNCPCTSSGGFICNVTGGVGGACGSVCGDGEVIGFEECDDGNPVAGDGCAGCRIELGWVCPPGGGGCAPECGDFVIRGDEECDDGNLVSGDGCDDDCKKEPGWACPAGMTVIGGQCVAVCGDGVVRGAESCDDNNTVSGDGCDSGCKTEVGWTCPFNAGTGTGGTCAPTCGDGLIRGVETCDEGTAPATGGCVSCQAQTGWACPTARSEGGVCATVCGDGIRITGVTAPYLALNEECDNGASNSNSAACTLTCKAATCSDGFYRSVGALTETDVDCGGVCTTEPSPKRCAINKGCVVNADCQSNYCDPVGEICAVPPIVAPTLYVLEGTTLEINVVSTLFAGNTGIDLNTFQIVGGGDSACGGDVDYDALADANKVFFQPEPAGTANDGEEGCSVGSGSTYSDAFSYRVCAIGGAPCYTATVTVVVNRRPVVADAARCLPINTASTQLDIATLYTDADGHALNPASITNTGTGGSHSRSGSVITFTPTTPANPATYNVAINACDVSPTPGCDGATWSLQWNDPPVVVDRTGGSAINVITTEAATAVPLYVAADRIVTNNGTVNNAISSVTVGAFNNGPFGATSTTARGSCTISGDPLTNGTIVYTAGTTTGSDSCYVRVCESCSGTEVCAVARLDYNIVQPPVANDDQVFGLEAANPATTGATATFTVATLTNNDTPSGVTNFAFTGASPGTTLCNGTVVNNAGAITYTGPSGLSQVSTCRTDDSFTYRVCSPTVTTRCDEATVHIEINRRPVLADTFTCSPINTPNRSINVNDLFTDPDNDLLVGSTILATGSNGASSRVGNVVTWTPSNVATATTYTINLTACDDATVSGCDTAVWTARWNDPPELRTYSDSSPFAVVVSEASTHALQTGGSPIIIGTGTVTGVQSGDPIASMAVGQFSNGPFSSTTATSLGGTCAIVGGDVVFTAGATAGNDSCFVQVCETCSGNNVCAVTRIPFKVINAPAPVNDSVQAAEGIDGRARGTFSIAALVANDLHVSAASFTLKNPGGTPGCAGSAVAISGSNVTYTGPASIATCATTDSFVYTVCSPDIVARCADATVTVDINRRPVFTDAFTCMPQGSTRGTYTVDAPNFTDSDNDDVGTVQATPAAGNPGLPTVNGATVTWAPDNRDLARYYDIDLNICDDATNPACTTGTWRVSWNDAPNLNSTFSVGCSNHVAGTLCVDGGAAVTLAFDDADANKELITNFGAVVGVPVGAPTPIGAVTFPTPPNPSKGSASVVTVGGIPTGITYTANTVATPTTDSFVVRVCELCSGNTVCSDRTVNVSIFPLSAAVNDTFGVLSTGATTTTVAKTFFTGNDANIDASTFALVGPGQTSCGGSVDVVGDDVLYDKPDDAALAQPACNWSDSFQYTVARVGVGGTVTGTVTIPVNRPPTLTFNELNSFVCRPTGTASHTLDLLPGIYADPDDATSTLSALIGSGTGGTITSSLTNRTVTLTPTVPATAQRFAMTVTATDDALNNAANNSRGAATGTWHSVWNDPPTFKTLSAIPVGGGTAASPVAFADIVDTTGAVNGLPIGSASTPWASVQVGSSMAGPFAATANLGDGSSCAVTGSLEASSVTFTAGATSGSKSCYVQVCEVCGSAPVCAVKQLQYTLVQAAGDTFAAAEGVALDITVASLLANDTNANPSTFTLVDSQVPPQPVTSGNSTDGGSLNYDTGVVTYLSKSGPAATDTFRYQVCSAPEVGCTLGTVTINVNRSPTLADATTCVPQNTASVSLDLNPGSNPTFTDADGHTLGTTTPGAVTGGTLVAGTPPNELLFTPTTPATVATYSAAYTACDNGSPTACKSGTWTILYNDPPTFKTLSTYLVADTHTLNVAAGAGPNDIIQTFGGVVSLPTTRVSATMGGYGTSATLNNGTCAVVNDAVVFTASSSPSAETDSCFIEVCECTGVCATVEATFTVVGCLSNLDCDVGGECGMDNHCAYPPSAPRNVEAIAVVDMASIAWVAPVSTGGSPILSYTATLYQGGNPTAFTCTATAPALDCDIEAVADGTYTAVVKATNAIGDSPNSAPSDAFVVPD